MTLTTCALVSGNRIFCGNETSWKALLDAELYRRTAFATKIANKIDFQKRMFQFFNHYLKKEAMPGWMSDGVPAVEQPYDQDTDIMCSDCYGTQVAPTVDKVKG